MLNSSTALTDGEVDHAALGAGAGGQLLGRVLREGLIAPETGIAQVAAAAEPFLFGYAEVLAHSLWPPLVQGAVDRMLSATIEHGQQRLVEQAADRPASHRATRVDVGQLHVDLAAATAVVEEVLGSAP